MYYSNFKYKRILKIYLYNIVMMVNGQISRFVYVPIHFFYRNTTPYIQNTFTGHISSSPGNSTGKNS